MCTTPVKSNDVYILEQRIVHLKEDVLTWKKLYEEQKKLHIQSRPQSYMLLGVCAVFLSLLISYLSMSFFQWSFNIGSWPIEGRLTFSLTTLFGGMFLVSNARSVFGRWYKGE